VGGVVPSQRAVLVNRGNVENSTKNSYCSYLAGQWVRTDNEFEVVNPATAQPFARVSAIDKGHLKDALCTAEKEMPLWRAVTAKDRGVFLHRVADEMIRRKAEIARTITLENGKPLAQSEGEVAMSVMESVIWS